MRRPGFGCRIAKQISCCSFGAALTLLGAIAVLGQDSRGPGGGRLDAVGPYPRLPGAVTDCPRLDRGRCPVRRRPLFRPRRWRPECRPVIPGRPLRIQFRDDILFSGGSRRFGVARPPTLARSDTWIWTGLLRETAEARLCGVDRRGHRTVRRGVPKARRGPASDRSSSKPAWSSNHSSCPRRRPGTSPGSRRFELHGSSGGTTTRRSGSGDGVSDGARPEARGN